VSVTSLVARLDAARAERERVAGVIAHCLHEPLSRARGFADAARRNQRRWGRQTQRLLTRLRSRRAHRIASTCTERRRLAAFTAYLEEEDRPKVLLGLHFGSFLADLIKLLDVAPHGTRVFAPVPARSELSLAPVVEYAHGRGTQLVLLPLKSNLALALRHARERGDVVLMLGDLGRTHGQTVSTTLFGASVDLVAGPYAIARLLRAPLVLVHSATGCEGTELYFDAPLDDSAPVATLAARYAQRAERVIASAPTRWLRWPRFTELLSTGLADDVAPSGGRR